MNTKHTAKSANRLLVVIVLFTMLSFGLLSFADDKFDINTIAFGTVASCAILGAYMLSILIFKKFDRLLFVTYSLLILLGLVLQYRMSEQNAKNQLIMLVVGIALSLICMGVIRFSDFLRRLTPAFMIICIGIMAVLLVIGKESGGAKNWIMIGSRSFQPSEFVKIATTFILASYLDTKSTIKELIIPLLYAAIIIILLVIEKDLGAAMLIALMSLIVYFAATENVLFALCGLGVGSVGAVLSYYLFDHVRLRVAVWQNPWITYESSGYQIVQGLMAIASGGAFGLGLGLGSPKVIPAYHTDYIFAVICEEFGIVAGIIVISLYVVFIIRGLLIALNSKSRFLMLLALGCTALIALQSFIIIAGVIKLIPLTGITLPFVSYGGSSLISCMMCVGLLQGIASYNAKNA